MKLSHCPVHSIVLDVARKEMLAQQRFMKASVMAATPFPGLGFNVADKIQWPYIRETIEQELGGEPLQPIVQGDGRWDPAIHPEKFLPGARHPTEGYARASSLRPEVARKYLERRYNMAKGWCVSLDRIAVSYQKQGIIPSYLPATLPPLRLVA